MTDPTRWQQEGGVLSSPRSSAVADGRLDEQFELDVAGTDALAAFFRPIAFAAHRGISFGDGLRMSNDLQPQG